jgi:hypothetical protein
MKGLLNGEPARFDFAKVADERAGLSAVQIVEPLAKEPVAKHLDGREIQSQRLEFSNEAANELQLFVADPRFAAIAISGSTIVVVAVAVVAVTSVAILSVVLREAVRRLRRRLLRLAWGLPGKLLLYGMLERVPELGSFGRDGSHISVRKFDLYCGTCRFAAVLLLARNFLAVRRVKLDHGNLLEGFEELQSRKL